ncbi:hypothetical protein NBRC10512v2_000060 [Rhodotorula toruloides]|uniref:RHTO0S14e03950g1_1 n=2 Tax=Rhodotorula toruloides TaxID=5286 RepID=A0A061BDK4_RHOTO|nr:uncharacterized protein RHTO_05060 [Rhodotorula toruloides NP11]EMS24880.1 hypothetical protein RHTO_05060 [Rhodotorula toruloides NP11]CDR47463.1 RHTO0S14e03950g1_1 [Rhodotorula toruloides]
MMRRIVEGFNHPRTVISLIPRGTALPPSLTILHEHTDHYSLQTTKRISLDNLNAEMTRFFVHQCEAYTKEQWVDQYGRVGETRGRRW